MHKQLPLIPEVRKGIEMHYEFAEKINSKLQEILKRKLVDLSEDLHGHDLFYLPVRIPTGTPRDYALRVELKQNLFKPNEFTLLGYDIPVLLSDDPKWLTETLSNLKDELISEFANTNKIDLGEKNLEIEIKISEDET